MYIKTLQVISIRGNNLFELPCNNSNRQQSCNSTICLTASNNRLRLLLLITAVGKRANGNTHSAGKHSNTHTSTVEAYIHIH